MLASFSGTFCHIDFVEVFLLDFGYVFRYFYDCLLFFVLMSAIGWFSGNVCFTKGIHIFAVSSLHYFMFFVVDIFRSFFCINVCVGFLPISGALLDPFGVHFGFIFDTFSMSKV
jgi:hypothetical protein